MQIMKARSMAKWNQIFVCLEEIPDFVAQSYYQKLANIKNKLQVLEKSCLHTEKKIAANLQHPIKNLRFKQLYKKQRKLYMLEYQTLLKTLSVMLVAVQNSQFIH